MKKGDIVVYIGDTLHHWPKNIRDGVVTTVTDKYVYVRPWGSKGGIVVNKSRLRVIYGNRLRNKGKKKAAESQPKQVKKEAGRDDLWCTFKGWKARGRYVRPGEKHRMRDENYVCLFHRDQTEKKERTYYSKSDDDSSDSYNSNNIHSPYVVSRKEYTGAMGASMVAITMSDGSVEHEWLGEDGPDHRTGISLGM